MQILVGITAYDVDMSTSVESLMYQIENKEFIPFGSFRLVKGSTPLDDIDMTLESYGITSDDEQLDAILQVAAGMRAKWKKKRMRRLRRKRRKMRQRAR